jgi:hypothetical protein
MKKESLLVIVRGHFGYRGQKGAQNKHRNLFKRVHVEKRNRLGFTGRDTGVPKKGKESEP